MKSVIKNEMKELDLCLECTLYHSNGENNLTANSSDEEYDEYLQKWDSFVIDYNLIGQVENDYDPGDFMFNRNCCVCGCNYIGTYYSFLVTEVI